MNHSQAEINWLNGILHKRVNASLKLEMTQVDNCQEQFNLKLCNEALILNADDVRRIGSFSDHHDEKINCTLSSVVSIIFAYLTRAEEYKKHQGDTHQRFMANESSALNTGMLERPIVDECFEVIRQSVKRQWPQIKLTQFTPKNFVTCDVDNPYELYVSSHQALVKKLGGDLLKRKSLHEFNRTWRNYMRSAKGNYSLDPNNTFDWMMDINEKAGNKMAFYFLVDQSVAAFDGHYCINEPRIRKLIRRIYDRGHEIGLHASYGTYKNPTQMKKEADKLRQVMDEEGVKQEEIGSRQHYLRWATPETARHLEAAGIAYDTTLGYADHAGFRCGTSHEFPIFDLENQKVLNLRERPLILMEASVLNAKYMKMGYGEETLAYMKKLKQTCHRYGGTFTMLWHNSHFLNEKDRIFYQELVSS